MNFPVKIVLFGSFYRGYCVLDELLRGPHSGDFRVVGVATDDVTQPYISREARLWQYPHSADEEVMVENQARAQGLPVYKGRIKTEQFYTLLETDWRPDVCLSATFGQRFDRRIFGYPRCGFFNLHPSHGSQWPSRYAGPNPFKILADDGRDHTVAALHRVDDGIDTGELMAISPRVPMPPNASVTDMHKLSSPTFARFAVRELHKIAAQHFADLAEDAKTSTFN
jgi:methionyl-tRNA formyltransferase